jgi:hypothetical protein
VVNVVSTAWLLVGAALAMQPALKVIDVRVVVWDQLAETGSTRRCDVLIRNVTRATIEVPRSPSSYTEMYVSDKGIRTLHRDCGIAKYPYGFVKIRPGGVHAIEIATTAPSQRVPKYKEHILLFAIDVYTDGEPRECVVEYTLPLGGDKPRVSISVGEKRKREEGERRREKGNPETIRGSKGNEEERKKGASESAVESGQNQGTDNQGRSESQRKVKGVRTVFPRGRLHLCRHCFCEAVAHDRLMPANAGTRGLHSLELLVEFFAGED